MPWNPATGMFEMGRPAAAPASPQAPTSRFGSLFGSKASTPRDPYGPVSLGGQFEGGRTSHSTRGSATAYTNQSLLNQEPGANARAGGLADRYDSALGDIEGTIGRFSDIYQKAGQAISDPAARDFQQYNSRLGANAASRFGGNISSEELRGGYNAQDLFARNLSEALARLGGEQVNAGLNYTGQLGGAAAQSADERDRLREQILRGISMFGEKQKGGGIGGALGGILGGVAGSFLGPLGTAAGTSLGGKIGGG